MGRKAGQLFIGTKVRYASGLLVQLEIVSNILLQYTTDYKLRDSTIEQRIVYTGNNAKSLHIVSVEASLKKLRTTYIDLLYLHWWNWDTGVEEVMKSLHTLVLQGKVIYLVSSLIIQYYDS